ncbi:unnamed protein product, partial [Nesidiocoris tenuis]
MSVPSVMRMKSSCSWYFGVGPWPPCHPPLFQVKHTRGVSWTGTIAPCAQNVSGP